MRKPLPRNVQSVAWVAVAVLGGMLGTPTVGLAQSADAVILQQTGNLKPQESTHIFNGTANQAVAIFMADAAFDGSLVLRGPDGAEVASNEDYGRSPDPTIVVRLPATGAYTIVARTAFGREGGTYTVRVREATAYDFAYADGSTKFQQGDYAGAIASLREAIRLDPDQPAPHLDLAEAIYAEATRLQPDESRAIVEHYLRAADLYERQGNIEQATSLREQASYYEQQP
ncbi:tetratricopeptide repeat protein [Leptolyngbya sp. AN02str]|uniref:tetratricopeptide repeat protein n=1 Tax=Leptolyngbya sp. AN02str TaxID=3423363 RepID=UPI003D31CFFC